MRDLTETYQSAPINFTFKFKGKHEDGTFIRYYSPGSQNKITYKVVFQSNELIKVYGLSFSLLIGVDGKVIMNSKNTQEENELVSKIVTALKAATYFSGNRRDFYPQS